MTTAQAHAAGRIREYLSRLTPLARSSLLTEIERLQLYGEDVSAFAPILHALRAEFRKSGDANHRIGNPSRHFFKPLEVLFVDRAPEKAGAGQISRGSLAAIWEWINHELLPAMARDYCETMTSALVGGHSQQANQIANGFQTKVVKSLEGMLGSREGDRLAEHGLGHYTSSHACMIDLRKMLVALQMREASAALCAALPPRIEHLEGEALTGAHALLDALVARHPHGLPFALTMVMKRLERPWQVALLAVHACHGKSADDIARTQYGIAVSMALDHLDERHALLKQALRTNRVEAAKTIISEIYDIEEQLRDRIGGLEASEWGRRLDKFMAELGVELEAELHTLPEGTHHVLEALAHRRHGGLLRYLSKVGRGALASGTACYEKLVGFDQKHAG